MAHKLISFIGVGIKGGRGAGDSTASNFKLGRGGVIYYGLKWGQRDIRRQLDGIASSFLVLGCNDYVKILNKNVNPPSQTSSYAYAYCTSIYQGN